MNSLFRNVATRRCVTDGRPRPPSRSPAAERRPVGLSGSGACGSCTRGSGTLLSVALIACGASIAVVLAASSGAALARQNLMHAADGSALAAADSRNGFADADPCKAAATVAAAFNARVSACQPCDDAMCVEVSDAFLGLPFTARARASGAVA
jgi:hypothetical protein